MTALDALIALLDVRPDGVDRWTADAPDPGWGRLYGGQVLAQALAAAERTAPSDRLVHSVHAWFLRPGRPDVPIALAVDRLRDGSSFTTRGVSARQQDEVILTAVASFCTAESGLEHQDAMPAAPPPEDLPSMQVLSRRVLDALPPEQRARVLAQAPFEIRPIDPYDPVAPRPMPPSRQTWFRATGDLPDDPALHRRLLAWAADSHFLTTATQPHAVSWLTPEIQVASLDHAMWFHRPFRADQWLLYDVHSPSLSASRALVRGAFYAQDGALVASTVQEGLIRDRRPRS